MRPFEPLHDSEPLGEIDLAGEVRHYWRVLKQRRFVLLTTFVIVVLSTAIYNRYQEPIYRASATLIIEPNIPHLSGAGDLPGDDSKTFYESQHEIIRSYAVAKMAVAALGIEGDEDGGQPSEATISAFQRRIEVEPINRSRLARVSMTGSDPEELAHHVNTLVRMYIYRNLEDRRAASQDAFTFLSERLAILKAQVAKSENGLLEYKEQEDIVSLEKRQTLVEERLSELTERHTEAALARSGLETVLVEVREIRAQPELAAAIPQIRNDATLGQLNSELVRLQLELGQLARKYRPKHPKIVRLQAQIEDVRGQQEIELDKAIRSLEVEYRIRRQTEQGIKTRLDDLKRQSRQLAQQAIQYGILKRDAESNRQMYDVLLQRLKETDFSGNITINNIRVVDQARPPSTSLSPRPKRALAIAAAVALVLGLFLCIAVDYFDNALQSEHDVNVCLESPVLGIVPRAKAPAASSAAIRRAYRDVKTSLDFYGREHVLRSLLVTSAVAGEGKTTGAVCLGKLFAGDGRNVLLVDADLVRPDLHRRFGLAPEAGLSDVFLHHRPPEEILVDSGTPGLRILAAGLIPPNPAEVLGSPAMAELVEDLKARFDLVILDAPPCSLGLEVPLLGSRVDGVAFVVKAHSTPRHVVSKTLAKLEQFQGNLVGVVLNGLDPSSEDLGGDYGYYTTQAEAEGVRAEPRAATGVAARAG